MTSSTLTLQQVQQQTSQLINYATSQITQEDAADPFSSVTMETLNKLAAGVAKASKKLQTESGIFSDTADLTEYKVAELSKLVSDVRESSRKLSIVLAAGSAQFRNQQQNEIQTLTSLSSYCDPEIIKDLDVPTLSSVLSLKTSGTHCPHGQLRQHCGSCRQYCPHGTYRQNCASCTAASQVQVQLKGDFNQAGSAEGTLTKLAKRLSELAEQCKNQAAERKNAAEQKGVKEKEMARLEQALKKLVPMLKSHVLHVGVGKGQHLNISSGCANVGTITQFFSYEAVENAHREMEDCRDRIVQELTMRKFEAKMNGSPCKRTRM